MWILLIIKIAIFSIAICLKNSYFPLIYMPSLLSDSLLSDGSIHVDYRPNWTPLSPTMYNHYLKHERVLLNNAHASE